MDADQRVDPDCMDIEHALSWAVLGALHRVPRPPVSPDAPLVLLACVEAEHHTLPLAALSAALAGHRIPARMLGAATPTPSLVRAVRDTVPGAVVVWAQRPDTAGPGGRAGPAALFGAAVHRGPRLAGSAASGRPAPGQPAGSGRHAGRAAVQRADRRPRPTGRSRPPGAGGHPVAPG